MRRHPPELRIRRADNSGSLLSSSPSAKEIPFIAFVLRISFFTSGPRGHTADVGTTWSVVQRMFA
jgi:hypothetical protein